MRDALGLVRLLWRLDADGIDFGRQADLAEIGKTLGETLTLGRGRPDTVGYRAAIVRADEAMDRLVGLGWSGDAAELVRLARARVYGGREPGQRASEREARKAAEGARR